MHYPKLRRFTEFAREVATLEWVRMAALIDGEGCIKIVAGRSTACIHRLHNVSVSVDNSDPRIPLWCREVFGGRVTLRNVSRKGCRRMYHWQAQTLRAEAVLRGCMPYFLIKREQAEIALACRATVKRGGGYTLSTELVQQREQLRFKLHELKRSELPVPDGLDGVEYDRREKIIQ